MARPRSVPPSHPDKRYFPSGFTKGEMVDYYRKVAPVMLPHLRGRPITLIRYPNGVGGLSFYEKNKPAYAPDWLKSVAVPRHEGGAAIDYLLVDSAPALLWCANQGAIEFHPFLHRGTDLTRPTHVAFDLDPGEGADVLACAEVAHLLKELCARLGLQSFPKVSGSKGLQVYVPINGPVGYAATGGFARAMAELLADRYPKLVVSRMTKVLRRGRVLIDWSQNSAAKTTVGVYSLRGKHDEPLVSAPVRWSELERAAEKKDPGALAFGPAAVLRRIDRWGDLFAPVLRLRQKLPQAFARLDAKRAAPTATAKRPAGKAASNRAPAGSALGRYAARRDFARTAEPPPAKARSLGRPVESPGGRFVMQKHAASHLHFDFRLEAQGVLKSWAVPKGLPYEPGIKRAAFEVEDHPLAYRTFEGIIPQGSYGGGTVMVWDVGTYELIGGGWAQADLKLRLAGRKLKGEWHLFRIRHDGSKPMWLVTKAPPAMKPLSPRREATSILSGRTMERIAADGARAST